MKRLKTFIRGAVVGGLLGILFAPQAGKKTRREIAEKLKELEAELAVRSEEFRRTWPKIKAGVGREARVVMAEVEELRELIGEKVKEFGAVKNRIKKESVAETRDIVRRAGVTLKKLHEENERFKKELSPDVQRILAKVEKNVRKGQSAVSAGLRGKEPRPSGVSKPKRSTARKQTARRRNKR